MFSLDTDLRSENREKIYNIRIAGAEGIMVKKDIIIPETVEKAILDLEQNSRIYIYLNDMNLYTICLITKLLLMKKLIPNFIFSFKKDREEFFKDFYNGMLDDEPFCTFPGDSGHFGDTRYLVVGVPGVRNSAWTGMGNIYLEKLPQDLKRTAKTNLISHWTGGAARASEINIFVKTHSKIEETKGIANYYDYEDFFIGSPTKRTDIIFIFAEDALPRPEKVAKADYKTMVLFDHPRKPPEVIDEETLGIPKIEIEEQVEKFFTSLDFQHKRRFVELFLRLVWGRFNQKKIDEIGIPDEFERQYFSVDISKRNELETAFHKIRISLLDYFMKNYSELIGKFDSNKITFNFDEEKFKAIKKTADKKLFVPLNRLFRKIFNFLFAQELVYCGASYKNYEWLKNEFLDYVNTEIKKLDLIEEVPKEVIEDHHDQITEDKIILQEQFGEYREKEIDCKRIILVKSNGQHAFMFIPVHSNSTIEDVKRDNKEINVKCVDLLPGDVFEKEYWNYSRLLSALKNRPDIHAEDSKLNEAIQISEKFRKALERFMQDTNRDSVMAIINERLSKKGYENRAANYMTIASWIDTVMAPIKGSYPTVEALAEILSSDNTGEEMNFDAKKFIDSCEYIKSKRVLLEDSEEPEAEKVKFRVESVSPEIVKVRGENVGRICTIT